MFCDQRSPRDRPLCHSCLGRLSRNDQACPICALPYCKNSPCPDCQSDSRSLITIRAPYIYDASIAYLISRWKYSGERRLGRVAAHLMVNGGVFDTDTDASIDTHLILPIPLHWRRQLARGFNQSEELLDEIVRLRPELAAHTKTALRLSRKRGTGAQAAMSRKERQRNLHQAFYVEGDAKNTVITLIDDVCTTGATVQTAAATLLEAGAADVRAWCLARTPAFSPAHHASTRA